MDSANGLGRHNRVIGFGKKSLILAAATAGCVQVALGASQTWGSLTADTSWSTAANWSSGPLASGDALFFPAAVTTTLNNDLAGQTYRSLNFNIDAPSYTINGNGIRLAYLPTGVGITAAGDIISTAVTDQTINLPLSLDIGRHNFTTGTNALNLHGPISTVTGATAHFNSAGGSINVAGSGFTTTNGLIAPWATFGSNFATLDGSNNVVPYAAYAGTTDIAGNGTLPNDATANVRITTTGNQTGTLLPAPVTRVNSLLMTTTANTAGAGAATIQVGIGNTLDVTSGGIYNASITPINTTLKNLNIGANVITGGILTAGDGVNPSNLVFTSNAVGTSGFATVNSSITDNATVNPAHPTPVSVVVDGSYVTLANANSYTGGTYILAGRVSQPTSVTFGIGPIYIFNGGEINPGAAFPITFSNNVFIAGNGTPETGGLGALRMFQNTNGQNTQITGTVTLMADASVCSNGLTQAQADASRNVGISGKITGPGGLIIGSPITTGGANGVGVVTVGALYGSFQLNDYAGDTTITGSSGGATGGAGLRVGAPSDMNIMPHGLTGSYAGGPTGNVVMNATSATKLATFDLNGSTQTINGLISTAASTGNNTVFSDLPGGMLILGDSNATAEYDGNVSDGQSGGASLAITKIGTGTQTFGGNLQYSGPTTVAGGTLAIGASSNLNSSRLINVQSAGNLNVTAPGTLNVVGNQILGGTGNIWGNVSMSDPNAKIAPALVGTAGTLTVNGAVSLGSGTVHVDENTPNTTTGNDVLQVNGNLTLGGSTTLQVERPAGGLANGTYPLIRYTGMLTGDGTGFTLTQNTRPTLSVNTATNGQVNLVVSGNPSLSLTWSGGNNGDSWDLVSTQNFNNGAQQFFNWDSVTFSDSGDNTNPVSVNSTMEPTNVSLTNTTAHPYNFIGGGNLINTTITKTGNGVATFNFSSANRFNVLSVSSGTLVLQSGNNQINGGTIASGGNVMVTGQGTFSNFTVAPGGNLWVADGITDQQDDPEGTIIDNGVVTFQHQSDFETHAAFAGSGTIVKQGPGQLQLDTSSSNPNFTGTFQIAAGKVRLAGNTWDQLGSTGGGTVIIANGAQLSLSGINVANLGGISENAGGGFGTKLFKVAGSGPDGSGVIFNNGNSQATAFQRVALTGDATFGANSRIDIRSGSTTGINQGTLDLAGHTLTEIGGNILGLANINVTDGNIVVNQGTLQIEGTTNIASLSAATNITVAQGLGINFLQTTGTITRPIVLAGDGTLQSINNALANPTSTVGSNISLGGNLTLNAPGASSLVLNGNISESPANSGRTVSKNTANMVVVLGGNNTYTGGTTVNAGTLVNNTSFFNNGSLNIVSGTVRIAQRTNSGDTAGVSVVPALSVAGGTTLDITNNGFVVDYAPGNSPLSTIQGYLQKGYANGAWTGTGGINSLTAANFNATPNTHKRAVGFAEASALGIVGSGNFLGRTVDDSSILIRYTMSGDANLDGKVNALDFNALATNFGASGSGVWSGGDFNYDGNVDTTDFTAMAQNFGQVLPTVAPAPPALGTLVPEPGTLTILATSVFGLLARHRRRR